MARAGSYGDGQSRRHCDDGETCVCDNVSMADERKSLLSLNDFQRSSTDSETGGDAG